jgi:hypothetical protein
MDGQIATPVLFFGGGGEVGAQMRGRHDGGTDSLPPPPPKKKGGGETVDDGLKIIRCIVSHNAERHCGIMLQPHALPEAENVKGLAPEALRPALRSTHVVQGAAEATDDKEPAAPE